LVKTVLTEEEKRTLRVITLELLEIRKLLDELAETMVTVSDKDLLRLFNADPEDFTENQIERYRAGLDKQVDRAENEFR
jgi:hypothetical protein